MTFICCGHDWISAIGPRLHNIHLLLLEAKHAEQTLLFAPALTQARSITNCSFTLASKRLRVTELR